MDAFFGKKAVNGRLNQTAYPKISMDAVNKDANLRCLVNKYKIS
jgi:hypothetical protein